MKSDYKLPFSNVPVRISQGYNGPWSHKLIRKNTDQSYSLDFALPVGTEVLAARGGILKFFYDSSSSYYSGMDFESGRNYIANMLLIEHDDGVFTCYQHIQKGSASALSLGIGSYIEQGRVIGKTGLSGWIGNTPHLHFMAYAHRQENIENRIMRAMRTVSVKFSDYNGPQEHSDLK